jgi:phosphoserine phosphatase
MTDSENLIEVDAAELLLEIDQAAKLDPKGIVAFDGDGTTWSGDVGEEFFHAVLERNDFRAPVLPALRAEAQSFGIAAEEPGPDEALRIARRLFAAYQADRFPEERICEVIAWSVAGWTTSELASFCTELVKTTNVRSRIHPETQAVLEGARRHGIPCYLVSASPQAVVEAAAAIVGIAPSHIVAARPAIEDGEVRPWAARPIPYGAGKVHNLLARAKDHGAGDLLAAFGDNAFDVDMLQHAKIGIAVRPKDRLRARASEVRGLRMLSRTLP